MKWFYILSWIKYTLCPSLGAGGSKIIGFTVMPEKLKWVGLTSQGEPVFGLTAALSVWLQHLQGARLHQKYLSTKSESQPAVWDMWQCWGCKDKLVVLCTWKSSSSKWDQSEIILFLWNPDEIGECKDELWEQPILLVLALVLPLWRSLLWGGQCPEPCPWATQA